MLVKQFGKPKSSLENLSDDKPDQTKDSSELTDKSDMKNLSDDHSYLIKDSEEFESKSDDKLGETQSSENKDPSKKQD
jgi:hypothetical protein